MQKFVIEGNTNFENLMKWHIMGPPAKEMEL